MASKLIFHTILLYFTACNASVLLWSKHRLQISPLKSFTDSTFAKLLEDFNYPEVAIYKNTNEIIPIGFKEILEGYHSAFSPNGEINTDNATEISGQDDLDLLKLKQRLEAPENENILSVLVVPTRRFSKREVSAGPEPASSSSTTEQSPYSAPSGPVFYKGESVTDQTFGLLYSSQPLLLKPVNGTPVYLGMPPRSDMITVDTKSRESYARLNINIPTEDDNKITLRFKFALSPGYWSLVSVKVSDTNRQHAYNLTIQSEVAAPVRFSHHCSGVTVFSDVGQEGTELHLYDMQAQIDAPKARFGDAYDCVNFTTVPIWSGLFVVSILAIGMIVALTAIIDIKPMDKFDNQKTKQLAITVAE